MSSAAWKAWRIFFWLMIGDLWFMTATAQPRGLTIRDSSAGRPLMRS